MNQLISQAMEIMVFGMAGIFAVLSLLFVSVKVLLKTFPVKPVK